MHYFFENNHLSIMEIQRLDLPLENDHHKIYHWLLYDKTSQALVKLWLRSKDSSPEIEERFFEQGYLKFSNRDATYIEKFNVAQHRLFNYSQRAVLPEISNLIENYLSTHTTYAMAI